MEKIIEEAHQIKIPEDERKDCRAEIYWAGDETWYPGICRAVEPTGGDNAACLIVYDDGGTKEWVNPKGGGLWIEGEAQGLSGFSKKSFDPTINPSGDAVRFKPKPAKWVMLASDALETIRKMKIAKDFIFPVNTAMIPGYREVIARPMDLTTVSNNLHAGRFKSIEEFAADMRLIFENCMRYNMDGSLLHRAANDLWHKLKKIHEKNLRLLAAEERSMSGVVTKIASAASKKEKKSSSAKRPKSDSSSGNASTPTNIDDSESAEMEALYTFNDLKAALNINTEARRFEVPPGWYVALRLFCFFNE